MTQEVFTILDKKSGLHGIPFFSPNKGTAIRQFEQMLKASDSFIAKYPEDFHLYQIGNFDEKTGEIKGSTVESVIKATDIANKE